MKDNSLTSAGGTVERLTRARTTRRGRAVEYLVHYERETQDGCVKYRLVSVQELTEVPVLIDSLCQ